MPNRLLGVDRQIRFHYASFRTVFRKQTINGQQMTTTTLTPRKRRQQQTKQAIIDAALHIITEKGQPALSMRAIARRIDYSPAGLYEYFGSKEEILDHVCQIGHQRLHAAMSQVDPLLSDVAYLEALGLAYVQFALDNPDYFLLMFTTESADSPPTAPEWSDSAFSILIRAIERGVGNGTFVERPGQDVLGLAYAAWSLVHGIAMLRLMFLDQMEMDFESTDRAALAAFARGIGGVE